MPYWNLKSSPSLQSLDNYVTRQSGTATSGISEFHELEPAIVLDVILDKNHEIFIGGGEKISGESWEADLDGERPSEEDKDFTWIGRALVRLIYTDNQVEKERLAWAIPLESNISEYPLINETVVVGKYMGTYYYSKKLNCFNIINHNVDFSKEPLMGMGTPNKELNKHELYKGPISKTGDAGGIKWEGTAGRYFWINKNIRALKRYEGDTIIESRFGQSIRFGTYDDKRENDVGSKVNHDYYGPENKAPENPYSGLKAGGGNPMILIRNRQRQLLRSGESKEKLSLLNSPNKATIEGTEEEKNVGGYIPEDINHDGSSIHITTGQTISKWVTTCYKKMFGMGEEVAAFEGTTNFVWPELSGDQIVINTDRLILSARNNEMFHFSKKRYSIVTDSEYTVDAHDQIVLTTHVKTVLNSPAIYLGEYDQTNEPVLLGQTSVNWLYEFCNLFIEHTHWYIHSHKDAGKESPSQTQALVQLQRAIALRDNLHTLLSRRVFVVGGGFAPGQNGASI